MGQPKRHSTKPGMGPTRASGMLAMRADERAPKVTQKRRREAIRVDEVGERAPKITLKTPAERRPRVVDRSRIQHAPLGSRDAFVLQMIDGTFTVTDLCDATGATEQELDEILARLVRLGLVAM